MPVRQSCPWYVLAFVLVSSVGLLLVAARKLQRSQTPSTLTELCERVQHLDPDLHVVQVMEHSAENGLYLCEQPHTRADLVRLFRSSREAEQWRGIVYCEHAGIVSRVNDADLNDWGEYTMQIGPLLFFGDPVLLEHIRLLIVKGQRQKG